MHSFTLLKPTRADALLKTPLDNRSNPLDRLLQPKRDRLSVTKWWIKLSFPLPEPHPRKTEKHLENSTTNENITVTKETCEWRAASGDYTRHARPRPCPPADHRTLRKSPDCYCNKPTMRSRSGPPFASEATPRGPSYVGGHTRR